MKLPLLLLLIQIVLSISPPTSNYLQIASENNEKQEIITGQIQNKKKSKFVLFFKATVFCILSLFIIATTILVSYELFLLINQQTEEFQSIQTLPRHFGVYTATPVKDQFSRQTCWGFATIEFLEERYRVQGFNQGYLDANQYVRFSEQAHGVNMINFCKANPDRCPDTPEPQGIARNGYNSWIFHFQTYLNDKTTVDLATCPYTKNESNTTDQQCSGMTEFQQSQRIKYNITDYTYLTDIDAIKRALVAKNQSMPLTIEIMKQIFYIPCDADMYHENTTFCKQKTLLCPQELQNDNYNRFCNFVTMYRNAQGEFYTHHQDYNHFSGDHKMLLVGYNDDYSLAGQNDGGFIVLNSWGAATSHSLKYLLGEISRYDENQICPNVNSPREWAPVFFDDDNKYRLRKPTVLQLVNNQSVLGFIPPGHFLTLTRQNMADALMNVPGLNATAFYIINNIYDFADDSVKVQMAVSNTSDPNQNFSAITEFITLPAMPLDYLAFFFVPFNYNNSMDNYDQCGYYYLPYDFVKMAMRMGGTWSVDVMDVEFTNSSFVHKNDDKAANGVWQILNATHQQNRTDIVAHTPWLQNTSWVPRFT